MNTIKNILVPIDFSDASINSVKYSIELARQFNAKLYIFHSYHIEIPATDSSLLPNSEALLYMDVMLQSKKDNIKERFSTLEKDLFYSNVPAREFVAVQGFVQDEILSFVKEKNIDLVVMASTGPHAGQGLFGTHITHLINKIEKPILVVPSEVKYTKIKDILMASDFGNVTENMKVLVEFALLNNGEVQIFYNETGTEDETFDYVGTASTLNHYLKQVPHKYHKAHYEDVEQGIINYVKYNKVDLLVLIPRHHSLFEQVFIKSTTKDMVFHTSVPLLVVPE